MTHWVQLSRFLRVAMATLVGTLSIIGCAEPPAPASTGEPLATSPASQSAAVPPKPATVPPAEAAVPDPAAPVEHRGVEPVPPQKLTPILGKRTDDVRDVEKEQAAGARAVQPKVTGQDPITISGSAYVSIIGRTEQLRIKHTLDLYYNLNGRYPRDLDEFMKEIIHANGIRLAQLPYYQKYAYDPVKHELVILEYPH